MLSHPTRHLALVFLFAATIATSCGTDPSNGDDLADTTNSTTTATSSTTTTTTTSPTTTTTEPTTSTTTVKDAVLEVHTRFMTEVFAFDTRVDGWEPFIDAAHQVATGDQLQRMEEFAANTEAAGIYGVSPGFDSNVVSVTVDDDHATVIDCSLDQAAGYDTDNNLVVPPASAHKLRRSELTLIEGQWYVEDVLSGGNETCDPEDYQ